jgi:hypothetical protein
MGKAKRGPCAPSFARAAGIPPRSAQARKNGAKRLEIMVFQHEIWLFPASDGHDMLSIQDFL